MMLKGRSMRSAVFKVAIAVGLMSAFGAIAHSDEGKDVTLSKAWARATPGGSTMSAAFLEISSKAGDKLIAVASPIAGRVEVHTNLKEGDVMKMRRVEALDIEPGTPRVLKPMGDHIMIMDLKEPLKEGGTLKLTLTFEKAGSIDVNAPILAPGATPERKGNDAPAGSKSESESGHDAHTHH